MTSSRFILKPLALACAIALTACSSGGDSAAPVTTITGTAEAPPGGIALLEYNQSFTVAVTEYLFPAAHAGITGLEPVTGATVELIRIDDDGNQVGDVLATTSTSITGDYSLALPGGVSLAGNLIVRITGSSGASMTAMVVEQEVDINPISTYILDKFVDDEDLVLADLALNEVISLQGKVEEFDLTATADLTTMLEELEAQVGAFVETEIAVIEATPDDGTAAAAVAGTWNNVDLSMGMHDSDPDTTMNYWGSFAMNVLNENMSIASAGTGELTITINDIVFDAWTNFSLYQGGADLYHEVELGGDEDSFPATIDADGNITISYPFEEDLSSWDPEGDGPDYGWRYPPGSIAIAPAANDNVMVAVFNEASVRYKTADTDADGIYDAVDPAAREGDEVHLDLFVSLKQGSGMSASDVDGDYGMVAYNINLDTSSVAVMDGTVGELSFDGSGGLTIAANAFAKREITRTPATWPAVTIYASPEETEPPTLKPLGYTVSATGQVTIDPSGDALEGYSTPDGSVLAFVDDESTKTLDEVTNVNNEMLVAVKLGSAMADSVNDATFKLYALILGVEDTGYTELVTLSNGTVAFNAESSAATLAGDSRGIARGNDVAEVEALAPEAIDIDMTASVTNAGKVTLNGTDGTFSFTMKGWVSADGNMMVLRHFGEDSVDGSADIGMIIGIKQ